MIAPVVGAGGPKDPHALTQESLVVQGLAAVHESRCIYIPGRKLSDRIRVSMMGKDDPYLTSVWDGLKDMRQIDQGAAVLAQEMKESVIRIGGLEGVDASTMADALMARLRTIAAGKGLLNAIVLGEGDEYTSRAVNTTGYKDLKGGARSTWAAYTAQPETVAFGATPGGLNTDGEAGRKAQDRVITSLQRTHVEPGLTRYYSVLVAAQAGQGKPIPENWQVVFRPLGSLTRQEEAQVRLNTAMADRIYIQMGVVSAEHVAAGRFGANGYQYELPPVPAKAPDAADPTRALAGPQGRTLLEYVLQVAVGAIPRETGVEIIMRAFQYSKAEAEGIMGDVGKTFFAPKPEEVKSQPDAPTHTRTIQGGKSQNVDARDPAPGSPRLSLVGEGAAKQPGALDEPTETV